MNVHGSCALVVIGIPDREVEARRALSLKATVFRGYSAMRDAGIDPAFPDISEYLFELPVSQVRSALLDLGLRVRGLAS